MLKTFRFNEFIANVNVQSAVNLPWVHSTSASNLIKVINDRKILAAPCTVFRTDRLCYLFVGRPAYKTSNILEPSDWQLPVVFVVRFHTPPKIKRVFPFDSGAFQSKRLPDYITMFGIDGYQVASDQIGRIVSFFFKTPERYVLRRAADDKEIQEEHTLDMRHAETLALARLFREGSTSQYDDRAAAIEVQIEADIPLSQQNLLGVVLPAEYLRIPGMVDEIKILTKNIETYPHLPLGTDHHYGLVYDCVNKIYKRAGVRSES